MLNGDIKPCLRTSFAIRFHQRFWRQGPWYSKDNDYEVDIATVIDGLSQLQLMINSNDARAFTSSSSSSFLMVSPKSSPSLAPPPTLPGTTMPRIRVHLTLDSVVPEGEQYKLKIVPEVVMPSGILENLRRKGHWMEGRYIMCMRIFVAESLTGNGEHMLHVVISTVMSSNHLLICVFPQGCLR